MSAMMKLMMGMSSINMRWRLSIGVFYSQLPWLVNLEARLKKRACHPVVWVQCLSVRRVLKGALDSVVPTGGRDEGEREMDRKAEYVCRPGEDIGGRLVNDFFSLGFRVQSLGWEFEEEV
jgi:hypothetical protein